MATTIWDPFIQRYVRNQKAESDADSISNIVGSSTGTANALQKRNSSGGIPLEDTGVTVDGNNDVSGVRNFQFEKLYFPKASTHGILVEHGDPTYPWFDMEGKILDRGIGANDPTLAVWKGGIRQEQFSVNDETFVEFHIPHDYVPGTDLFIHAHWTLKVDTVTSGGATWGFESTYAKGHQQAAFSDNQTPTIYQAGSGTAYLHMIAEVQLSASDPGSNQLDSSDIEVDGLIITRAFLSANNMNDTPEPFLHFVDIHYQSRGIGTKQKAPNFYV